MSQMIHIIDDDDQVRASLGLLLETSGHVVRTFASGDEYLTEKPDLDHTVIVLDVRMPGRDGVETLAHIRQRSASVPVIMISGHGDIPLAVKAMQSGANDFVEKPFVAARILAAIDMVDYSITNATAQNTKPSPLSALTPRETEVVRAVADGKPNKVVAHELGISIRTVETHRARAMSKLNVSSLADLVKLVLRDP